MNTQPEDKHSELLLPFKAMKKDEHCGAYVIDATGATVCDLYFKHESGIVHFNDAEGRVELIVTAVNQHEALLKKVEEQRAEIKAIEKNTDHWADKAKELEAENKKQAKMKAALEWLASGHDVQTRTKVEADYWANQFKVAMNQAKQALEDK